jgi:hypothetical protein
MWKRDVRSTQVSGRGATKSDKVGGSSYGASRVPEPTPDNHNHMGGW